MNATDVFVLLCGAFGILSAAMVAFHPNILYAAVSLIFTLLSVAGFYAVLGADFLAGAQLIIYVGGIIVVILFAVMMSRDIYKERLLEGLKRFFWPLLYSIVLLAGILSLIYHQPWVGMKEEINNLPVSRDIGKALVGPYALVFQYVAIVLLIGLIGAVVVARPEFSNDNKEEGDS